MNGLAGTAAPRKGPIGLIQHLTPNFNTMSMYTTSDTSVVYLGLGY
jgi:hypothetical protein